MNRQKKPDRKPNGLLLFGLQRCATNLCQKLMSDNLDLWLSNDKDSEWKHGTMPRMSQTHDKFLVICVKHPQAWLVSMYKYIRYNFKHDGSLDLSNYKAGTGWPNFLRNPHYGFQNPCRRWNAINEHWIGRAMSPGHKGGFMIVRAEDLQGEKGQVSFVNNLSEVLSRPKTTKPITTFKGQISNQTKETEVPANWIYYSSEGWRNEFNDRQANFVRGQLDWGLAGALDYEFIEGTSK